MMRLVNRSRTSSVLNRSWYIRSVIAVPAFSGAGTVDLTISMVLSLSASAIWQISLMHLLDTNNGSRGAAVGLFLPAGLIPHQQTSTAAVLHDQFADDR
jgi:hypothetical protein